MKILIFGATSTIAQELQKLWASQGHSLILIARDKKALEAITQDLRVRSSAVVTAVYKDLLETDGADGFIEDLWRQHDGFDWVFMAHGILGHQREDEKSFQRTLEILKSNFISHVAFLTPIAQKMSKAKKGLIAVITSVGGERGKQSNYIYGAAKSGKIAFLSGLRNRLFFNHVQVIDLRLGFVDTKMTKDFKKGLLWISPKHAAALIHNAMEKRKDIAYIPGFWRLIMMIIRSIPESLFKKLKL